MAGSLLAEISLLKLVLAWLLLIVLPGLLLGLTPLIVSGWLATLSRKLAALYSGFWPFLLFAIVVATGWIGGRPFLRAAEQAFWSLNSVAVQPGYARCAGEPAPPDGTSVAAARRHRAVPVSARRPRQVPGSLCAASHSTPRGICRWPASRWVGTAARPRVATSSLPSVLASTAVILGGYLAVAASLVGIADATMDPRAIFLRSTNRGGVAV
jgi:hypothetical protein